MRTIKFRGKRTAQGNNWIYGYYAAEKFHNQEIHHAIFDIERKEWREVYENTVGQFSGLFDRNGKEVYEGDIIADATNTVYVCAFEHGCFDFRDKDGRGIANPIACVSSVVGNIHDNPDMMEGGER